MAAVTINKIRVATPVGYEFYATGTVTEDVTAGTLLQLGANGWSKLAITATEPHGIALMDYYAGEQGCDIGITGELDGYSGLTPGAPLYPSAVTAGVIATDVVADATIRMRAASTTRIRFSFV